MSTDPILPSPPTPEAAWHGRRGELLVVVQFVLFGVFVFAPVWNPWLSPGLLAATVWMRTGILAAAGLAALLLGLFGVRSLGPSLTPLPYPVDHNRLVTEGVYALVRHPLYSSQIFAALAWVSYTLSLSHLALLVAAFLFFDYKAGKEESWLTERHPEYPGYAARVRKLIPWVY
jgi:protein-S-isoprenylcysteine O-methyltransferase Ste14